MTIKAVIFDLGGVFLNTPDKSWRRKWELRKGLAEDELIQKMLNWRPGSDPKASKKSYESMWDFLSDLVGLEQSELPEIQNDFFRGSEIDQVLKDYTLQLRQRGYKTSILSNAWPGGHNEFVKHFQLDDWMDDLVFSSDFSTWKPDAKIYDIAVTRLNLLATETIFVDDTLGHVEKARERGMVGIHFITTEQAISEIEKQLSK